jgi:bifunctional non-homologous end joining protein LigD
MKSRADLPADLSALRERVESLKPPERRFAAHSQQPMLATLLDKPFSDPDWLFEIKHDGVRVLADRKGDAVQLYGRNGTLITSRYPELCAALKQLVATDFTIDGEIVAPDEQGRPSFQKLQGRMHLTNPRDVERAMTATPVEAIFFDCLQLEGYDLRSVLLLARKECLKILLSQPTLVRYSDHVVGQGEAFFAAASKQGVEGIIGKKIGGRYIGGRSRDWVKIKCQRRQEFVIGGYTDPQGGRIYFGALHLGLYENNKLVYVSKVGTGFDAKTLKMVWQKMLPLKRATSPFEEKSPSGRGHHWIDPELVCEVRFTEWTHDGGIRHPAFLGLRTDKKPRECHREDPADTERDQKSNVRSQKSENRKSAN